MMTCHTISNVQIFNLDTHLDFYFCISSNFSVVYHISFYLFMVWSPFKNLPNWRWSRFCYQDDHQDQADDDRDDHQDQADDDRDNHQDQTDDDQDCLINMITKIKLMPMIRIGRWRGGELHLQLHSTHTWPALVAGCWILIIFNCIIQGDFF